MSLTALISTGWAETRSGRGTPPQSSKKDKAITIEEGTVRAQGSWARASK